MAAKFTEEDDRILLRMRGECKYSIAEVAKALGKSSSGVYSRALFLCKNKPWTGRANKVVPKPVPFTKSEDAILLECKRKGMRWMEVCEKLVRFSEHQARNRYRVLTETVALTNRTGAWSQEEDEELMKMADAGGMSLNEIASNLAWRSSYAVQSRICLLRERRKIAAETLDKKPTAPAVRKCIGWYCGREFLSPHAGVRFCPQCRREPKYEMTCREAGV